MEHRACRATATRAQVIGVEVNITIRPGGKRDGGMVVVHDLDELGNRQVDLGHWTEDPIMPIVSLVLSIEEADQLATAIVRGVPH